MEELKDKQDFDAEKASKREKYNQKMKNQYQKTTKHKNKVCEICGGKYIDRPSNKLSHFGTNKHIFYFENPDRRSEVITIVGDDLLE